MESLKLTERDLGQKPWPVLAWLEKHPVTIDILLIIACVAPQTIAVINSGNEWDRLSYATLAATAAALFWRRKYPLTVLTIVVVAGALSPLARTGFGYPAFLPIAVTLYTVAAQQPFYRAAIGYGIGIAIPTISTGFRLWMGVEAPTPALIDAIALVGLVFGVVVRSRRERRISVAALVNERIENAAIRERARITAEMHDVVAHSVSVIVALANGATAAWDKQPDQAAIALEKIASVGRDALGDMQRTLHLLRTNDAGLEENLHRSGDNLPSIDDLASGFGATGLPVTVTRSGPPIPHDTIMEHTIYRIVQESLTNALRHARNPAYAEVEIHNRGSKIDIVVTNDGDVVHSAGPMGHGLVGIRQRVATHNGALEAGPRADGGWRTHATLQIPNGMGRDAE